MRITLEFAKTKFEEFNELCFDSQLPPIPICINNSRRALGMFVHPRSWPLRVMRGKGECHLRMSCRLDLPQTEIEDTLIHEMIHYYIWYFKLKDTSTHGRVFRQIMNGINTRFNRNITITHKTSEEELNSDNKNRNNYICVSHWRSGETGITISARTKILDIDRVLRSHPDVSFLEWYWSRNPWFNRYPVSRSAKIYKVESQDKLTHELLSATPCEVTDNKFKPKR